MSVAPNSLQAYDDVLPVIGDRQAEILAAVQKLGPCTDRQISAETRLPINCVTPRRGELVELGLLVKAGDAINEFNRRVSLWSLPRKAPEQLSLGIAA